jgi:hypothetical protein
MIHQPESAFSFHKGLIPNVFFTRESNIDDQYQRSGYGKVAQQSNGEPAHP